MSAKAPANTVKSSFLKAILTKENYFRCNRMRFNGKHFGIVNSSSATSFSGLDTMDDVLTLQWSSALEDCFSVNLNRRFDNLLKI